MIDKAAAVVVASKDSAADVVAVVAVAAVQE